jgi:aconitate decarboxylase
MTDPIDQFAAHVVGTHWQNLPPEAVSAAKTFILDTLGVAVAGSAVPQAEVLRDAAARWGAGNEAQALGTRMRLPAAAAALVNAFQAHNQEFDCIHEAAVVHPLATVLAASLAVAERQGGITGRDLILAIVSGVDVSATIGAAARNRMTFFRPATAGIFGATAAAGRLLGLDRSALLDAFGLALGQAAGTMQAHAEGKPSLALQIAMAARAAVNAVDLAAAGFPAPHAVLEGPYGFFPLMEGRWDLAPGLAELGRTWRVCELSHKPFPTGRATHGGIDGLLRLAEREGFNAEEVERVTLLAPPLIHQLVGRPYRPDMAPSYARLCFPFVGALALSRGSVGLDDFTAERMGDRSIAALAARTEVTVDANPDRNALMPQMVRVALKSGRTVEETVTHAIGSPRNPLTPERQLAKFRACWASAVAPLDPQRGELLIALVDRLEELDDVRTLVEVAAPK